MMKFDHWECYKLILRHRQIQRAIHQVYEKADRMTALMRKDLRDVNEQIGLMSEEYQDEVHEVANQVGSDEQVNGRGW
jgi:hypothetical protein